jgi:hypothetical protein
MTQDAEKDDYQKAEYVVMDALADQYVELARALGFKGHEAHEDIVREAEYLLTFWKANKRG